MEQVQQLNLQRTPGIVIFVAILNFLSAALFGVGVIFSTIALIFGNVLGISEFLVRQMNQYPQATQFTAAMNSVFVTALVVCLLFAAFFVFIGVGLLRTSRTAWYFQVALSVMGLLGFPFYTILNALILVLFFQNNVRDHFGV